MTSSLKFSTSLVSLIADLLKVRRGSLGLNDGGALLDRHGHGREQKLLQEEGVKVEVLDALGAGAQGEPELLGGRGSWQFERYQRA